MRSPFLPGLALAGLLLPGASYALELCSGKGDMVFYGRFNDIDICRQDQIECKDGYTDGAGRAWIFPTGTIRSAPSASLQKQLIDFITSKRGLADRSPQIQWGFFSSDFVEPKGRRLREFTSIGGFGFKLSYTEADLKSTRTIAAPETFAQHTVVVNHCEKAGYLPVARTIYYYFPELAEENTGPIPFEALMSSKAAVKAVPKPGKPFSGV